MWAAYGIQGINQTGVALTQACMHALITKTCNFGYHFVLASYMV